MFITDLNPGDGIEYTRQLDRNRTKDCKGIVIQVTDKHITVDLGKYKDSFQVCDIGKNVIITFPEIELPKEDEEVKKQDLSQVTTEQLKQLWEEGKHRKDYVRQQLGTNWYTAVNLLIQHGIIEASDDEEPFNGIYPIMKKGHIDWRTMWPAIQAELDKGTTRAEVADKFNVPHESLADMIQKERGKQKVKEKIEKAKELKRQEAQANPDNVAHLCNNANEKITCSQCGKEIEESEILAINDETGETTCFDCIPKTMTPDDILNAKIEVTEEPLGLDRLKVEPTRLQSHKKHLLEEAQKIDDALQLIDLCLYWYDRGRQDAKEA